MEIGPVTFGVPRPVRTLPRLVSTMFRTILQLLQTRSGPSAPSKYIRTMGSPRRPWSRKRPLCRTLLLPRKGTGVPWEEGLRISITRSGDCIYSVTWKISIRFVDTLYLILCSRNWFPLILRVYIWGASGLWFCTDMLAVPSWILSQVM